MDYGKDAALTLSKIREMKPLIHHITNFVVMNETANITLATGASPVMAHAKEEVIQMVGYAGALVLNIGTLWPDQVEAMLMAGKRANELDIPVVLDPVGAGATDYRTDTALKLLNEVDVSIVRGNMAEIGVLAGTGGEIKGVDAVGEGGGALEAANAFASKFDCVAAITGRMDIVAGKRRVLKVANGDPIMAKVTGTGCMATSVVAAFAAASEDYVEAAAEGLAAFGLAGQKAARDSDGPGTFHVRLYDAMANLTDAKLTEGAKISDA